MPLRHRTRMREPRASAQPCRFPVTLPSLPLPTCHDRSRACAGCTCAPQCRSRWTLSAPSTTAQWRTGLAQVRLSWPVGRMRWVVPGGLARFLSAGPVSALALSASQHPQHAQQGAQFNGSEARRRAVSGAASATTSQAGPASLVKLQAVQPLLHANCSPPSFQPCRGRARGRLLRRAGGDQHGRPDQQPPAVPAVGKRAAGNPAGRCRAPGALP